MYKSIETTGKTEEEAIQAALALLGLDRDEISVEILERAKPGFLGIGSSPARIKVTYEAEDDFVVKIRDFLEGLLSRMGSDAKAEITAKDETTFLVNLTGDNLGPLIGRRGETLDAIQHLTNFSINRATGGKHLRISIDAEDYRSKREQSLESLAKKVAGKVLKYRKNMTLEPMNSYERHVIHTALQEFEGVTTYSVGTEPNRRVVIAYGRARGPRQDSRPKR
ncbi:MAG: protein jag [Clostridiales bacterium]|jgi:spoIIIJ-associated protein|nr:protein jag [Clostridiales bacterium]